MVVKNANPLSQPKQWVVFLACLASLVTTMTFSNEKALASEQKFTINYELVEKGLAIFDTAVSPNQRSKLLDAYLNHPLMIAAFERYSDPTRPPESRVDRDLYAAFLDAIFKGNTEKITHPRMKMILGDYLWGKSHLDDVRNDFSVVRNGTTAWLDDAKKAIPWGTQAAQVDPKPINVVFLFDPGGSYPWATENQNGKYIYIDILKVRGFTDEERKAALDPEILKGFLVHEIFHLVQADRVKPTTADQWLTQIAVAEGAASLFGNNAYDSHGERLHPSARVLLGPAIEKEWRDRTGLNKKRVEDFLALLQKWKSTAPADSEKFKVLTDEKWISSASNGLLIGDIYRVGMEMLMEIRRKLGQDAFLSVIGDSSTLVKKWHETQSSHPNHS
jgi:hypothetical protein